MLETGVPRLDLVLGGGLPERDILLVAGIPGAGKTTLCLQMAFHLAAQGRNVVYVSSLATLEATVLPTTTALQDPLNPRFPEYTIADGNIELEQLDVDSRSVRNIHVRKLRGRAPLLGRHALRIGRDGPCRIQVFCARGAGHAAPEAGNRGVTA